MKFTITKGKIKSAQKVVIYGPEGIGKSTFASRAAGALFIDVEGSTKQLDVRRLPKPQSWAELCEEVDYIAKNPELCGTLVIDTFDKAEELCIRDLCAKYHKNGIEDFGYGNGYVYVKEEIGRMLDRLENVIDAGVNVILTAHAQIRKFEQPDELGAYDRYELKLGKKTSSQTSPLIKEWADAVLFANYKTYSTAVDDKGKKHKAQGGKRVMYTSHHPCWDAKNRWGLPDECEFDYDVIAGFMGKGTAKVTETPKEAPTEPTKTLVETAAATSPTLPITPTPTVMPVKTETPIETPEIPPDIPTAEPMTDSGGIPPALTALMNASGITAEQIQKVVAQRGYFPPDMPIRDYPADFIDGVLIGAWDQVKQMIVDETLPF